MNQCGRGTQSPDKEKPAHTTSDNSIGNVDKGQILQTNAAKRFWIQMRKKSTVLDGSARKRAAKGKANEKRYKCGSCDYATCILTNFSRHIMTHSKETLFPCNVCRKRFITKQDVVSHMRTHLGEFWFKCSHEVCCKSRRYNEFCTLFNRHKKINK